MATIRRRGDKWQAIVRMRGVYRSETFNRQAAAREWGKATEDAIRAGTLGESEIGRLTLAEAIARYEKERRAHKALSSTIRGNLRQWERTTGEVRLGALTAADVLAHAAGRTCGPATMLIELSALRGLLVQAKAWGLRLDDPIAGALPALRQMRRVGKPKERDRRPTADELQRLRDGFLSRRLPMADVMDFAVETAMRLGEIVALRWADVDRERKLVLVRDRKDPQEKEGNDQWVPLLGRALEIIDRQPPGDRIFPFHPDSVSRAFTQVVAALGIEDLHFHDLRHEGASRLFEQGYRIEQVALVTGHKDWKSLQRYTQLKPESLHR